MCNLHLNVAICMAWCEVECGRDVNGAPRCGGVINVNVCEMWCNVECCNLRHGVIEMQNVM